MRNTINQQLILFKSSDGNISVDIVLKNDSVWLNQKQISELFVKDRTVITKHINKIFNDGELEEKSNVQKLHIANSDKPV